MDPATSADAQKPPAALALGQTRCQWQWGWRGRAGCALNLALLLAVTASFAGAAYRARHRPRDLAFVAAAYYLLALLLCCAAKLEVLRAEPRAAGDLVLVQRRRVRLAVWAVSVALSVTFASRVAEAMPLLALKLAVWGVTAVFLGLGFCLLFCCGDAELGPGLDHGGRPAKALHELSPEEMA